MNSSKKSSVSDADPREPKEDPSPSTSPSPPLPLPASTSTDRLLASVRLRGPRPPFRHPLAHDPTTSDVLVDFDGPADPHRPLNWPFRQKILITVAYGLTTMTSTFASSVYSSGIPEITREFGVSNEVATLGTSLLLIGLGVGPLLWAPVSEVYGRRTGVLGPVFVSALFAFGCGAGENIQTVLICRFFQGFFGSAPISNTGGVLGDIWTAQHRGSAMVLYALAVVGGPTLGPIVGGALCVSGPGWRWTQYISGIFTLLIFALNAVACDETYPGAVLQAKARVLRHVSGNWALHAKHEEWNVSIKEMINKYLVRPIQLLRSPICFLMALYAAFCYGILFASLGAFPVEFQEIRGWNELVGSLPFLAMLIGTFFGAAANFLNQKFFLKALKANHFKPVPEARLPPMMGGSILFAAGLFIFAWTSDPDIHWMAPCVGIFIQGVGYFTIYQAALNYLVDTFHKYAASAVAANTFLRSIFAGAFPLFIVPCLHNLGVGWGMSIFAFVAAIMIPIPYVFYVFGKRIRASNAWSREGMEL